MIRADFELPFHYRYRMPIYQELYVNSSIPVPSVFVKCSTDVSQTIE